MGSEDERRPNPTQGNQTLHSHQRERDSERGEGDLGELERGTGGQGWFWRLTDRGLGREEGEKRGGGLLEGSHHCLVPLELYFNKKRSESPELVFPSSPPEVHPVT